MRFITLLFVLMLAVSPALAQSSESWISPDDVNELTADDALLMYCSTCANGADGSKMRNWVPTSIGNFPDVDIAGAATGDLLYRSADGNWYVKNVNELVAGSGTNSIAVGNSSAASNTDAVAIGTGATTSAIYGVAIGNGAASSGTRANIAIGEGVTASNLASSAIGKGSVASGSECSALGGGFNANTGASCTATKGLAIGHDTLADQASCVALGTGSDCDAINTVYINGTTANLEVSGTIKGNVPVSTAIADAIYTLQASDCGSFLYFSSAADQTLVINDDATTSYASGCNVGWGEMGDGILTVSASGFSFADGNVTYSSASTRGGSAVRMTADVWLINGGQ